MAKFFRILLSVLAGFVVGSAINMGLILVSGKIIPPPPGADVTTTEGLRASLHLFQPKHFVFPFLAHALGTLSGAFVAGLLAPVKSVIPAYSVGFLFMVGGIASVFMLPAPTWFNAADLLVAYLPTACLGQALANRIRGRHTGGT